MAFQATVLRVMIASPSDVSDARDAVESAIHGWNSANSMSKGVVLQPWRWESSAVPILGEHPQSLINAQGVANSDLVFALFGSRLGSPTAEAVSGTVEEIEEALSLGKPVHLYFSTSPLPRDVDTSQLEGLRTFRKEMEKRGLLGEFDNPSQLEHEVWKAIEHDIATIATSSAPVGEASAVRFIVQPQQEREVSGFSSSGSPRYTTRHWADITNDSDVDAIDVTFESMGGGLHLGGAEEGTIIHARQTRRLSMLYTMGGAGDPVLKINWKENGEPKSKEFHVR